MAYSSRGTRGRGSYRSSRRAPAPRRTARRTGRRVVARRRTGGQSAARTVRIVIEQQAANYVQRPADASLGLVPTRQPRKPSFA